MAIDDLQQEQAERQEVVSSIRSIAKVQGQRVSSKEIASSINAIAKTVVQRVNQMSLETTKGFLPIQSQLKQVQDLLQSSQTDDQERAFELIDRMQERLGVDLSKYSKEIGDSVKKLYEMNQNRKEDKAQAQQIHTQKVEELKQEQTILRERGINTVVNEENYKLELRTKEQEKQETRLIIQEEKRLRRQEKDLKREARDIQRADVIDTDRQEKFLNDQKQLSQDQLTLQDRKEEMRMKPGESSQGFISQTFGAAGGEIKNLVGDIKGIGKSIVGSFSAIPDLVSGFGKGITMLAGRFKTLALALLPAILGFIMLAMPVIAIIGAVILAVTAFRKLVDYISNSKLGKFFGMDKDKEKPDVSKDMTQEQFDQNQMSMDETYLPDSVLPSSNGVNTSTGLVNDGPIVNTSGGNVIKPNNNFNVPYMDASGNEQESPFFKSANNMTVSKDQLISDEGNIGKTENNVIAPTSNTQVTTNNSTSVIDISPKNSDNSFLNLDYHSA